MYYLASVNLRLRRILSRSIVLQVLRIGILFTLIFKNYLLPFFLRLTLRDFIRRVVSLTE